MTKNFLFIAVVFGGILLPGVLFSQNKETAETEKQAATYFEEGNYIQSQKLYNQLITLYPKDPNYNYRYGACVLFTESDKQKSLKYLEFAVSQPEVENEAFYYLGKGYHFNYRFNEAIEYYNKFQSRASSKELKNIPVVRDLRMAQNGFQLLKNINEPKVFEKKKMSENDFYLTYQMPDGYKILKAPSVLKSEESQKKNFSPVIIINQKSDSIIVPDYDKGSDQTDLYWVIMNQYGDVTDRVKIEELSSPYNDAYAFFDVKRKHVYFSSQGFNSMGGFDIFRATFNSSTGTFSTPENLDYAYNTPDDDIMFVQVSDEKAYFTSSRNNNGGEVSVFQVDPAPRGMQQVLLVGTYTAEESKVAQLTIEDSETGQKLPEFSTRAKDGFYMAKLQANHRYRFLVEPQKSNTIHSGTVEIPVVTELKPLKQEMYVLNENGKEKLVIKNLFDEKADANDQVLIAQFLQEMAGLNEQSEEVERNISLTNEQVISELKSNKEKLNQQISSFNSYADNAYKQAQTKSALAQQDMELVAQLEQMLPAESDPNYESKKKEIDRLKKDAHTHSTEAAVSVEYAKTLEQLAANATEQLKQTEQTISKAETANANENRNELVNAYLAYNDEVSLDQRPADKQAKRAFDDKKVTAKKEASDSKIAFQKLSDQQTSLTKSISYTESQIAQAKKKSVKDQLESDLVLMKEDLDEISPKVSVKYQDSERKQAISDLLNEKTSETLVESVLTENNAGELTHSERKQIQTQVNSGFAQSAGYFAQTDYQFNEAGEYKEPVTNSNTSEVADNTIEEEAPSESIDPIEEPVVEESTPQVIVQETYDVSNSPYDQYYVEQEAEINAIEDPYLKTKNAIELKDAQVSSVNQEIAYIAALAIDAPSEDIDNRVEELQSKKLDLETEKSQLQSDFSNLKPETSTYQPTDEMMEYPSIQDLEDQYYFEYEATFALPVEERLEKQNAINQDYISEINFTKQALESELETLDSSSESYASLQNEVTALSDLEAKKQANIEYNNAVLGSESYVFDNLDQALAANTIQTTIEVEEVAEPQEELAEVTTPITEETTEQEPVSEPLTETNSDSEVEPVVVEVEETEPLIEEPSPNASGFTYFESEEAIQRAPIYFEESPYNETYESQLSTSELYQNPVDKTDKKIEINQNWLNDINKEIESLTYVIAHSNNTETILDLEDKRAELIEDKKVRSAEITMLESQRESLLAEGYLPESEMEVAAIDTVSTDSSELIAETEPVSEPEFNQSEDFDVEATEPTETTEELAIVEEPQTEVENDVADQGFIEEVTVEEIPDEEPTQVDIEEALAIEEQSINEDLADTEPETELNEEVEVNNIEAQNPEIAAITEEITAEKQEALAEIESTDHQIQSVQNRLAITKKKKDRERMEAELDQLNESLIMQQAMLKWAEAKEEKVDLAQETLIENPTADLPSESYYEEAKKLETEAVLAEQAVQDQQDLIGSTKKKKERKALSVELDAMKVEAANKRVNANQAMALAKTVQEAEVITLKNATPFGSQLVVDLPQENKTLTETEQKEISTTTEYQTYQATEQQFEKSIQEAEVLYQEATENETKGRELLASATLYTGDEADSVKLEGQALVDDAIAKRSQAKELEKDAYYSMNMARKDLLAIEDSQLKSNLIAYTQNNFSSLVYTDEGDIDIIPAELSKDIFKKESADLAHYNDEKPIPVDVELPKGVIYKVQVGAFRNAIPQETFKGFAPIVGESTGTGLTRYTAGLFDDFETANDAKTDIRGLGYGDAFVVAYLDGKRISLAEARNYNAGGNDVVEETPVLADASESNTSVEPTPDVPLQVENIDVQVIDNSVDQIDVMPVASRASLFYTVQIGAYSSEVSPSDLFNISPINSEETANGLIRYSTGVFSTVEAATVARDRIRAIGISDAFVTAYRNGSKISVSEAQSFAQTETPPAPQETEEVVTPEAEEEPVEETPVSNSNAPKIRTTYVDPETGEVEVEESTDNSLPPSTAESDNAYRVEIGPYEGQVPVQEARVILEMSSIGVNINRDGESTTYYIGNYRTKSEADRLLQIVTQKGLISPKVVKFENGQIVE